MHLKQAYISLAVGIISFFTAINMYMNRKTLNNRIFLISLPLISTLLHLVPFFFPFFVSSPARMRRIVNGSVYILSGILAVSASVLFFWHGIALGISLLFVLLYFVSSMLEVFVYLWKWYTRARKRKEFKNRPLIRRRFGASEIKMPIISVTTESINLRAKNDFTYNSKLYIKRGEVVELLKPIGSYYSVRTSKGAEYIVPKENFHPLKK